MYMYLPSLISEPDTINLGCKAMEKLTYKLKYI